MEQDGSQQQKIEVENIGKGLSCSGEIMDDDDDEGVRCPSPSPFPHLAGVASCSSGEGLVDSGSLRGATHRADSREHYGLNWTGGK